MPTLVHLDDYGTVDDGGPTKAEPGVAVAVAPPLPRPPLPRPPPRLHPAVVVRCDGDGDGDGGGGGGQACNGSVGEPVAGGANDDVIWRWCLRWLLWSWLCGTGGENDCVPRSSFRTLPRRCLLVLPLLPEQVTRPVREVEESEYDGEENSRDYIDALGLRRELG